MPRSEGHRAGGCWWRKAAEQGIPEAQYNWGVWYQKGDGTPRDLAQAVYWYRKAAEQGNAHAQNNLGACCAEGEGMAKDLAQAVSWWRKAAEQGDVHAQCSLGEALQHGRGVKRDLEQAVFWYRKAAEQGLPDARHVLADLAEENPRPPVAFIVRAWHALRRKISLKKMIGIALIALAALGECFLLRYCYLEMWTTEYIYPRGVELTAEISSSRVVTGLKWINHEQDLPPEFPGFYLKVKDHLLAVTPDIAFPDWEKFAEKIAAGYHVEKRRTATTRELRFQGKFPPSGSAAGKNWVISYRNNVVDRLEIPLDDNDSQMEIGLHEHSLIPIPLTLDRLNTLFGNGKVSSDGKLYTRSFSAPITVIAKGIQENNTVTCLSSSAVKVFSSSKGRVTVEFLNLSPWRSQSLSRFPVYLENGDSILKINRYTTVGEWVSFCEKANIGYTVRRNVYHSPNRTILTVTNDKKADFHFTVSFGDGKLCSYTFFPSPKMKIRIGSGEKYHVPPFSQEDIGEKFISHPKKSQYMYK